MEYNFLHSSQESKLTFLPQIDPETKTHLHLTTNDKRTGKYTIKTQQNL